MPNSATHCNKYWISLGLLRQVEAKVGGIVPHDTRPWNVLSRSATKVYRKRRPGRANVFDHIECSYDLYVQVRVKSKPVISDGRAGVWPRGVALKRNSRVPPCRPVKRHAGKTNRTREQGGRVAYPGDGSSKSTTRNRPVAPSLSALASSLLTPPPCADSCSSQVSGTAPFPACVSIF